MVDITKKILAANTQRKMPGNFRRPEGAGNFDNMDDNNIVRSINIKFGTTQTVQDRIDSIVNKGFSDSGTQTFENKTIDSVSNDVHANVVHERVFNNTGSTLTKGQVVYVSGFNVGQDAAEVDLADADDAGAMPAIGVIEDDIATGQIGEINLSGIILGFNTTAWDNGDELWVDTTPGGLTKTKPTATNTAVQKVAQVVKKSAQGSIYVFGAGRANDIPNEADREFSMGSNKITNVTDPTNPQDAATRQFVLDNLGPTKSAFSVYLGTGQDNLGTDYEKVLFDTEVFDNNGEFASNRFTTTQAGFYILTANIRWSGASDNNDNMDIAIYKNGVVLHENRFVNKGSIASHLITAVVESDGDDYFEIFARNTSAGGRGDLNPGSSNTWFTGARV